MFGRQRSITMKGFSETLLILLHISVVSFILLVLIQTDFLSPILQLNLADFTKSPLPPYRDAIARSIGSAAIYFSVIEGSTPYNAKIKSSQVFVDLSKSWYAPYFLLGRKLLLKCGDCDYSITESPTMKEATDSSTFYKFKVTKN